MNKETPTDFGIILKCITLDDEMTRDSTTRLIEDLEKKTYEYVKRKMS